MIKILKYSISDLLRSRWSYVYFIFYLLLGFTLLFLNKDIGKAVITLLNIIVILTPLIGTVFGVMYHYNSREFTELLLALPIKRRSIFLGQYLGVSLSLSMSVVVGLGIPFLIYGSMDISSLHHFITLLVVAVVLTMIFVAISFNIALKNDNKIKGFGFAILAWLLMAIIYDGLLMAILIYFSEYPIDKLALALSAINPIDLSRILVILKLDISALLGYTGALFNMYFGSNLGVLIIGVILGMWLYLPIAFLLRQAKKKDF